MQLAVQLRDGRGGLGHLHQGEHALLHAGAAGSGDDHQRDLLLQRAAGQPGDLLPDDRAHGPAHEREVHHAEIERKPIELGGAGVERIAVPGLLPGGLQTVGIVLELERVGRAKPGIQLAPGSRIGQERDVIFGADAAVLAALGTDVERLLELLPDVDVPAAVALLPGVGRNLQPFTLRRPWLAFLLEPCHHGHRDSR